MSGGTKIVASSLAENVSPKFRESLPPKKELTESDRFLAPSSPLRVHVHVQILSHRLSKSFKEGSIISKSPRVLFYKGVDILCAENYLDTMLEIGASS